MGPNWFSRPIRGKESNAARNSRLPHTVDFGDHRAFIGRDAFGSYGRADQDGTQVGKLLEGVNIRFATQFRMAWIWE